MSESGSGEPIGSSTDAGKNATDTCPDCGKSYASNDGLVFHLNSDCNDCTGLHTCPECGRDLMSKHGLKRHYGMVHDGSMRNTITCENCGSVCERDPAEEERYEYNFCSKECKYEYAPLYNGGKNHPLYESGERMLLECDYCGVLFERLKCNTTDGENIYCSESCLGKWRSENLSGKNSHAWKGGSPSYYGPNWIKQREKAIKRDHATCQICGSNGKTLDRSLEVHHKRPIRKYKNDEELEKWWQQANVLSNLLCLCVPCHRKWEGIPVLPET